MRAIPENRRAALPSRFELRGGEQSGVRFEWAQLRSDRGTSSAECFGRQCSLPGKFKRWMASPLWCRAGKVRSGATSGRSPSMGIGSSAPKPLMQLDRIRVTVIYPIWISAAATLPREFRARFRSLYNVREGFFQMKELSMRPTKTCFISDDRIDAVLIGTSIALIILLVIVAV